MITAILTLCVVAASHQRDAQFEANLAARYEQVASGLGADFGDGTAALDEGRVGDADAIFTKLTERAPVISAGFRRLAYVRAAQKRYSEALALAEKALELEPGVENELGLIRLLVEQNEQAGRARGARLLDQQLTKLEIGTANWVDAKQLRCWLDLNEKNTVAANRCVDTLLAHDDSPASNWVGFGAAAAENDFQLSRSRLEKARPGIDPTLYREMIARLDEVEPWWSRYGWPALRLLGVWAAAFVLMALLGSVLSAVALSAAHRLATKKEPGSTSVATRLRGIYRAVLGLGALYYYVSLPVVAAAVLVTFGGAIYLSFAVGHVPIKLVLIAFVVGAASLFALVKSLFVRVKDEDPGLRLKWEQAPKLKAVVDEVAKRVGTRSVDTVFVTPGTELAVFERGGYLARLRGQGRRCLIIGRGVLDGFERRGFESVLAHELGHFLNRDTAGGDIALVGRNSLMRMGIALAQSGAAGWYNPAWLFFRGYYAVFLRISQGASRLQEVLADRVAIFAYGSAAFAAGYRHVITQSVRFDAHVNLTIDDVVKRNAALGNLYRFVPATPAPADQIEAAVTEALDRPAGPYDSHPSSRDRLNWAQLLDVADPDATRASEPVLSWFEDLEALDMQMTDTVCESLAVNHDLIVRRESWADTKAPAASELGA